jgi:hypothetical protein
LTKGSVLLINWAGVNVPKLESTSLGVINSGGCSFGTKKKAGQHNFDL